MKKRENHNMKKGTNIILQIQIRFISKTRLIDCISIVSKTD